MSFVTLKKVRFQTSKSQQLVVAWRSRPPVLRTSKNPSRRLDSKQPGYPGAITKFHKSIHLREGLQFSQPNEAVKMKLTSIEIREVVLARHRWIEIVQSI